MADISMIRTVISEYGVDWAKNRALYSAKLKLLRSVRGSEIVFEHKTPYPERLDLFLINVKELRQFLYKLPIEDQSHIIAVADKACRGLICGFSSLELDYGNPVDWQLNPLTGVRCDEKLQWFRIPDFDETRGDIKTIWEASRFSHFITLARAYLLTDGSRYYKAFSEQLRSWLKDNPYGYGANYKCGQECSFRMVNALLAFTVFRDTGIATDSDAANMKDLIDRCYRKVLSNFFYAHKCIKNNHTISELMGMIVGAWCCSDQNQVKKAFHLLNGVIDEQFTKDGGYRQFSFNYQRLALQDLECILSIENKTGQHLSDNSLAKIKNAALLMYQCQDASGDMPNYGSNDGALVFPMTSCGYRDFNAVINTTYALSAGTQLFEPGKHQEELVWFAGKRALTDFPMTKVQRQSSQFAKAGLFTIRNEDSWAMLIINDYHSRPAHFDQLHFDLWIDGSNVFCDAGTYSYASESGRILIKEESHNTLKSNGKNQMKLHGPFLVYNWTKRIFQKAGEDIFEGVIRSEYSHRRRVKYSGGKYAIEDWTDQDGQILFHTPCEIQIEGNEVVLFQGGKRICSLKSDGNVDVTESRRSLFYLKELSDTCIAISIKKNQTVHTDIVIGEEYRIHD